MKGLNIKPDGLYVDVTSAAAGILVVSSSSSTAVISTPSTRTPTRRGTLSTTRVSRSSRRISDT